MSGKIYIADLYVDFSGFVDNARFPKNYLVPQFILIGEHGLDVVETIISSLWIILSLLLIFLLPGYIILYALYPKKDELGGISRIAIGFTLSIAVVMISNLTLDLIFGVNTTPGSILILTIFITVLFLVIWMIRIRFSKQSEEKPIKKLII